MYLISSEITAANGICPFTRFAEKCGIPYMTVKRILSCDVQKIDIYTILCIARATRTPIMEILGDESENLELYKRISHISEYEKTILTNVLNILEKTSCLRKRMQGDPLHRSAV